jgi:hypothetical protein
VQFNLKKKERLSEQSIFFGKYKDRFILDSVSLFEISFDNFASCDCEFAFFIIEMIPNTEMGHIRADFTFYVDVLRTTNPFRAEFQVLKD